MDMYLHFWSQHKMKTNGQSRIPSDLRQAKDPSFTLRDGGWVGSGTYLDAVKKRTSLVPVWNQAPAIEPVSRPYND
jgi:hypothetical protein